MDQELYDYRSVISQPQVSALDTRLRPPPLRIPLKHEAYDVNPEADPPDMSRSPSVVSDRFSTVSALTSYFPANPSNVHPAPAYVAPFGASQVVSEHQASRKRPSSDDEDAGSSKDEVQFSEPALALVNAFLDQLLYAFLSTARSTSLPALRLAVIEVLKHRFAKEAIASADEELRELLAGGEEEAEESTQKNAGEAKRKWDLELVWKRTRLRVMVYTRLGELEDDDEEKYVREQELFDGSERRFSSTAGLVSWAAAIFLTSVLEYVAEQTLQVAGQAASKCAKRQTQLSSVSGAPIADRVTVEVYDVEKVALSSTLGRLWRTWRKSLRNNGTPTSPSQQTPMDRMSVDRSELASPMSNRRSSFGTAPEGPVAGDYEPTHIPASNMRRMVDVPDMQYPEHVLAANILLPIGETKRDIDEIEVPGLARTPDSEYQGSASLTAREPARRKSFTANVPFRSTAHLLTPVNANSQSPAHSPRKPALLRQRSMSAPAPLRTRLIKDVEVMPGAFPETPAVEKEQSDVIPEESQNFDAEDMAPHKPASQDVSKLLDKVVENVPPDESEARKEQSDHHGLVGAAVAGVTAAAAAAMVYGSKEHHKTSFMEHAAPQHDESGEGPDERRTLSADQLAPYDQKAVEELDKRKSLFDIKSLIVHTPGGSDDDREASGVVTSRRPSAQESDGQAGVVGTESEKSGKSYTLGDNDKDEVLYQTQAMRQDMPRAQVEKNIEEVVQRSPATLQETPEAPTAPGGRAEEVTQTSVAQSRSFDTDRPTVTAQKLMSRRDEDARDATAFTSRPSGTALANKPVVSPIDSPPHPTSTGSTSGPRDFLQSRSLSSTSKPKGPVEQAENPNFSPSIEQTRTAATRSPEDVPGQSSLPGPVLTTGEKEASCVETPSPQSRSPALGKEAFRPKSLPAPPKRDHKDEVREHPVVLRMASLKRSEKKPEEKPEEITLTSASIKGPEDFDMFVRGEDIVKYTLTPETVRDSGPSTTSYLPVKSAQLTERAASQIKRPPSPLLPRTDTRQGRSQDPKSVTSSASPQSNDARESRKEHRRSISRLSPRNLSAHRKGGLMAREPRVMTESTCDFSDFIRSTGPSKELDVGPILTNPSTTSLHSLRSASVNGSLRSHSPSSERAKSLTKSAMEPENIPPVPPMPGTGKPSMKPRDAVSGTRSNSDLINFIRDGPDQAGQHRIPRIVAPFRSTMDSDQLKDLGERIGADRRLADVSSVRSTGASSQKSVSNRTSTHSQVRLLNGGSSIHPAYNGQPQRLATPGADDELPRRRFRNKDPYAIDSEDEDEDLLTALPHNKRQEENLEDFLRNNEPPPDNAPRPIVNGGPAQARSMMNRARVTSSNSLKSADAEHVGRTQSTQSPGGSRNGNTPSIQSVQSNKSGSYSRQAQIANTVTARIPPRKPIPRMAARSPGSKAATHLQSFHHSETSDLADFLRNSGPEGPVSTPAPIIGNGVLKQSARDGMEPKKEKRGFFSRKPKSTTKSTYLDMP